MYNPHTMYHPLSPWKRLTGHLISFGVITISHDRIAIMSYHARAHVYALLFVYCVTLPIVVLTFMSVSASISQMVLDVILTPTHKLLLLSLRLRIVRRKFFMYSMSDFFCIIKLARRLNPPTQNKTPPTYV